MAKSLIYLTCKHEDQRWDPYNAQKCWLLLDTILADTVHVLKLRVGGNSRHLYIFILVPMANHPSSDIRCVSCVCTRLQPQQTMSYYVLVPYSASRCGEFNLLSPEAAKKMFTKV